MIKKITAFFRRETNFVLALIFLISFFGLLSLFYDQWVIRPKSTIYCFAHNYMPDYYQYLSWMKDGSDGKFLITSRLSPDNFPRRPVYLFYPFFGFLVGRLGLNLYLGYTLVRIAFSLLKIFVLYWLIGFVFKKASSRKLAFLIALFLPPFYSLRPFTRLFSRIASVDILHRAFFIPHNLATTGFVLIAVLLLYRWLQINENKNKLTRWRFLIFAAILFILAAIANPAMLSFYYLFLGLGFFITFLQKPSAKLILAGGVALLAGLPLIIYYQLLFKDTLPFSWMYEQQKIVTLDINFKGYFFSLGPAAILFFFSLKDFFKKKDLLANFLIVWAIIPFLLEPLLGRRLPVSQERLFELSHFIPLSILATATLEKTLDKFKKPFLSKLVYLLIVMFSVPYLYLSVKSQLEDYNKPYINIYLEKSLIEAFSWLDKNTPDESVVSSGYYTSNMIPAFTHNKVLFGHDFVTYRSGQREQEMKTILNPQTEEKTVREILKRNKISYLLITPETGILPLLRLKQMAGTEIVFANQGNTILKTGY